MSLRKYFLVLFFIPFVYSLDVGDCGVMGIQEPPYSYDLNETHYLMVDVDNIKTSFLTVSGFSNGTECTGQLYREGVCGMNSLQYVNTSRWDTPSNLFDANTSTSAQPVVSSAEWAQINFSIGGVLNSTGQQLFMYTNLDGYNNVGGSLPSGCRLNNSFSLQILENNNKSSGFYSGLNLSCLSDSKVLLPIWTCRSVLAYQDISVSNLHMVMTPVLGYPGNVSVILADRVLVNTTSLVGSSGGVVGDLAPLIRNLTDGSVCSCAGCVSVGYQCAIPLTYTYNNVGYLQVNYTEDLFTYAGGYFYKEGKIYFSLVLEDFIRGGSSFKNVLYAWSPSGWSRLEKAWISFSTFSENNDFFVTLEELVKAFILYIFQPATLSRMEDLV